MQYTEIAIDSYSNVVLHLFCCLRSCVRCAYGSMWECFVVKRRNSVESVFRPNSIVAPALFGIIVTVAGRKIVSTSTITNERVLFLLLWMLFTQPEISPASTRRFPVFGINFEAKYLILVHGCFKTKWNDARVHSPPTNIDRLNLSYNLPKTNAGPIAHHVRMKSFGTI